MKSSDKKTVIIVTGPTATGKTGFAISLARQFDTEIISADSRQCYRELDIGVARPSNDELSQVPHHFIASSSIQEEISAADFERMTLDLVQELFKRHDVVVMAGGTGLYIKAFCEGLDSIPDIDPRWRKEISDAYKRLGMDWLREEIRKKDPVFFDRGEMKNPRRIMRALEVVEGTGHSIFDYRKNKKAERPFNIIKIGLRLPRAELYSNINRRVDKMMQSGLEKEAAGLFPFRSLSALQTVGYQELFKYMDKKVSLDEAVENIKKNTRRFAKRQLTWFRKDKDIRWFAPSQITEAIGLIELMI